MKSFKTHVRKLSGYRQLPTGADESQNASQQPPAPIQSLDHRQIAQTSQQTNPGEGIDSLQPPPRKRLEGFRRHVRNFSGALRPRSNVAGTATMTTPFQFPRFDFEVETDRRTDESDWFGTEFGGAKSHRRSKTAPEAITTNGLSLGRPSMSSSSPKNGEFARVSRSGSSGGRFPAAYVSKLNQDANVSLPIAAQFQTMPPRRNPLRTRGQATVDSGVFAGPLIGDESSRVKAQECEASEISQPGRLSYTSDYVHYDENENLDVEEITKKHGKGQDSRVERKWWVKGAKEISKSAKKVVEKVEAIASRTYRSLE